MRILVRLALLCAAVLSLASVAGAGERPGRAGKGKAEKGDAAQNVEDVEAGRTTAVRAGERHGAWERRG
jgi:hypothetical protein